MAAQHLRARGDRELADLLLADHDIKSLIEHRLRDEISDARRHLLAVAVRLTTSMAPSLIAVVDPAIIDRTLLSARAGLDWTRATE